MANKRNGKDINEFAQELVALNPLSPLNRYYAALHGGRTTHTVDT